MDRLAWLKEKRRESEQRMDTMWAPIYDDNWGGRIEATHRGFFARFLAQCPARGVILDAACGSGKYWPLLLERGLDVHGIDQSQAMLDLARRKFPAVPVEKLGLQDMTYREAFDGAVCMDAMEMVPPEDWPLVLANLYGALKPDAPLYLTVELAAAEDVQRDYEAGRQLGLPVVYGESAHEGGYHYYPSIEQVKAWLQAARFHLVDETVGDEYHHLLVRRG